MLIRLLSLLLLLVGSAHAQVGVGTGSPAPDLIMPPGKFYVNKNTIPKPRKDIKTKNVYQTCGPGTGITCTGLGANAYQPNEYASDPANPHNGGSFRVNCTFSHASFDDPIVYPGQSGRTHLHAFYGNNSTRSSSDLANMATVGNSTCTGGTVNRSGYWVEPWIYYCPPGSTNGCTRSRDGEVNVAPATNFYYKCDDASGSQDCVWMPPGFRMISGNASATSAPIMSGNGQTSRFDCFLRPSNSTIGDISPGPGPTSFDHIPTGAEADAAGGCNEINQIIGFNTCWDGVNIDSPDHHSHVGPADFYKGCHDATSSIPSVAAGTFPVHFPTIVLNIHYLVKRADLPYMRLSSDPPASSGQPAGWTTHADWVNGWDNTPNFNGWGMTVTDAILKECYAKFRTDAGGIQRDCHDNLLGSPLGDGKWWSLGP